MSQYPITPRTKLVRLPKRGSYDAATIHAILDEAPMCHIGTVLDGLPYVVPATHWRIGEELFVHGATCSRSFKALAEGAEACVTVSLADGWVLARSAFHHSVNYRSVMLFGRARLVTDMTEKSAALLALIDRVQLGRGAVVRPPNANELKATALLAFPLDEVSAKVRMGPPVDDAEDMSWPVWAGIIPLTLTAGDPIPDNTTTS